MGYNVFIKFMYHDNKHELFKSQHTILVRQSRLYKFEVSRKPDDCRHILPVLLLGVCYGIWLPPGLLIELCYATT